MKALLTRTLTAVVVLLGAFAQARTPQEILADIKSLEESRHQAVLNLGEALADNDKTGLLNESQNVIDLSQQLLALLDSDETKAAFARPPLLALRSHVNTVLIDVQIAKRLWEKDLKTQAQKIGGLKLVTKADNATEPRVGRLDGSQPIVLLSEVNARTAGFMNVGRVVTYAVRVINDPGGTITEVTPRIVNPASGLGYIAVQPTPSVPTVVLRKGRGTFTVTMGPNLGGGRVYVDVGGQPAASRLLFNKGPKLVMTYDAMGAHSPFDGSYVGGFSGSVSYRDPVTGDPVTDPVNGGVAFTVAGRRITVTQPANGHGVIAITGTSSLKSGAGSLSVPDATVTFHGALSIARNGSISALGSWQAWFKGGHANGTWSAGGP